MSKSLAGGLLPLGPRAGSNTAASSSTLTGGLIPLGNKSRPSVDRDDQEEGGWGGGGSRWSGKEDDSGLEEERLGNETHPDNKVCLSLSIFHHLLLHVARYSNRRQILTLSGLVLACTCSPFERKS